jgi:hypothetical protein
MFHFTAIVTFLAILLYFSTLAQVARARTAFGIIIPFGPTAPWLV